MKLLGMDKVVTNETSPDMTHTSDTPASLPSSSSNSEQQEQPEHDDGVDTIPRSSSADNTFFEGEMALKTLSMTTVRGTTSKCLRAAQDLAYEVAILASMPSHPNIIKLYGVNQDFFDDTSDVRNSFLVLEKLQEPLDKVLKRWKREATSSKNNLIKRIRNKKPSYLSAEAQTQRIQQVAVDLATAMKFLHDRLIIFRDLKPANIGLDKDGKIRLFDFACARQMPNENCKLKHRCGTLRYMAPEVAQKKLYDLSADVYSFGMVLWELCALERPYETASDKEELNHLVIEGPRPSLKKKVIDSTLIQLLLEHCWKQDPNQRPSMDSVCYRLDQVGLL